MSRIDSAALVLAAITLMNAHPVGAVDGVIEINQAKALAGGINGSDAAGFPVLISVPGSYRLTGDLDLTGLPGRDAISVDASHVTIDLNGFSIRGPVLCSGTPVTSCTNTGSGDGITNGGQGDDAADIRVRNGTIAGMPARGIFMNGVSSIVEDVRFVSNGGHGIALLGAGSVVTRCVAIGNGMDGIRASRVLQSEAYGNSGDGIETVHNLGDVVLESRASNNGAFGLNAGLGVVGYGQNSFICNNSSGSCTNDAQVNAAVSIELGTNLCGTDAVCP